MTLAGVEEGQVRAAPAIGFVYFCADGVLILGVVTIFCCDSFFVFHDFRFCVLFIPQKHRSCRLSDRGSN